MQLARHNTYLTAFSKVKILVRMPFILLCFACLPQHAFSQYEKIIEHLTVLPFGCNDTLEFHHITYEQMLANWSVKCKEPNCVVKQFMVSFLPKGKDFEGPFPCFGSKNDFMALRELKLLKDEHVPSKVFIEVENIMYTGGKKNEIMKVKQGYAVLSATNK